MKLGKETMNRIRTFSPVVVIVGLLAVLSMFVFAQDGDITMTPEQIMSYYYAEGVNDALDAITLLSLEQRLDGTRRTWGEMSDIVRKRLHVQKRKK